MRIIAGQWRSRLLQVPKHAPTRPMTDRVRESVFDILGSRLETPGLLPPLRVADVFAGSGSLGLEALSRGAAECWFFESAPMALRTLQANLDALKVGPIVHVARQDVWVRGLRSLNRRGPFDLVFVDPPFRDSEDTSPEGRIHRFVIRGNGDQTWSDRALMVVHHEARSQLPDAVTDWQVVDRRIYGRSGITFMERGTSP